MTEMKENTSWQGGSVDRQSMIDKIYEVVWYNEYIFKSTDSDCWSLYIVMIWDVLDYVEKNVKKKFFRETNSVWILDHWDDWRKPIDDQSIECLERVIWFV